MFQSNQFQQFIQEIVTHINDCKNCSNSINAVHCHVIVRLRDPSAMGFFEKWRKFLYRCVSSRICQSVPAPKKYSIQYETSTSTAQILTVPVLVQQILTKNAAKFENFGRKSSFSYIKCKFRGAAKTFCAWN